jgi:endogenous inhibitor of DNA gyrase (YacG/DUF329 family)
MASEARRQKSVACPGCGSTTVWSTDNPFRPFCSERCKLIDFGQWATGAYRIPQEEADAGTLEAEDPRDPA